MSEIQESYALLVQIDKLLADIELKINNIEQKAPQMERNLDTFRQIERLALRWLAIGRRMGLPEDVDSAVNKVMQLVTAVRMLQISMSLMYATNPLTAAIGIAGLVGSVMTMTDVFAGY